MEKMQTIIWDLDGTLINSFDIFAEVLSDILPHHGYAIPSKADMLANFHGSLGDSICEALGGGLHDREVDDIVRHFLEVQDAHYEIIEHHLYQDAVSLARRLHSIGATQLLVTNRDHLGRLNASPRNIVANSELHKYIDAIICGDDSEHRKPKPEVLGSFRQTCVPEGTLVIGDQFVDIEFAHNLGTNAVLVNRSGEQPHHLDRLQHDWQSHVTIVDSLDTVIV